MSGVVGVVVVEEEGLAGGWGGEGWQAVGCEDPDGGGGDVDVAGQGHGVTGADHPRIRGEHILVSAASAIVGLLV